MNIDNYNPFKKHLFTDNDNRTVYYDYQSKIGYVITEAAMKKYQLYANRWLYGVMAVVLLISFNIAWYYALVIGIVCIAALAYIFYKRFLPSLVQLTNFDIAKYQDNKAKEVKSASLPVIIVRVVLYNAAAVLLVINAYDLKMNVNDPPLFYLSWALAFCTIAYGLYNLRKDLKERR